MVKSVKRQFARFGYSKFGNMFYTGGMSMIAAGAYLRTLREQLGLPREKVAALAGTNGSQLVRIESGEQETRGSLLAALIRAVKGNADQVMDLILDESATAEDGQRLALSWFTGEELAEIHAVADAIPDHKRQEALAILQELIDEQGADLPLRVLKAIRRD